MEKEEDGGREGGREKDVWYSKGGRGKEAEGGAERNEQIEGRGEKGFVWEVGRESVEWRERVAQRDLQRERERESSKEGGS